MWVELMNDTPFLLLLCYAIWQNGDYPGWGWPNQVSPLKVMFSLADVSGEQKIRETSQLTWKKVNDHTANCLVSHIAGGCSQPLGAGCHPWLTTSRKMGTSAPQLQRNEFCQQWVNCQEDTQAAGSKHSLS
jgi:hypothetical protein